MRKQKPLREDPSDLALSQHQQLRKRIIGRQAKVNGGANKVVKAVESNKRTWRTVDKSTRSRPKQKERNKLGVWKRQTGAERNRKAREVAKIAAKKPPPKRMVGRGQQASRGVDLLMLRRKRQQP
jgi:hypothetical protein